MFITVFTTAHHLSLSWVRSTQFTPPHPTSWRIIWYHALQICRDWPTNPLSCMLLYFHDGSCMLRKTMPSSQNNSERNLAAPWRWHCFAETCRSHRVNKEAYNQGRPVGGASGALAPGADFEGAPQRRSQTGHKLIRSTVAWRFKRKESQRNFFFFNLVVLPLAYSDVFWC
jgi:hypothetical protein